MKKVKLPVIIERDEDGYFIVSCPLFKGCHTYGETLEEAMENIREVIDLCLEEKENQKALEDFDKGELEFSEEDIRELKKLKKELGEENE